MLLRADWACSFTNLSLGRVQTGVVECKHKFLVGQAGFSCDIFLINLEFAIIIVREFDLRTRFGQMSKHMGLAAD